MASPAAAATVAAKWWPPRGEPRSRRCSRRRAPRRRRPIRSARQDRLCAWKLAEAEVKHAARDALRGGLAARRDVHGPRRWLVGSDINLAGPAAARPRCSTGSAGSRATSSSLHGRFAFDELAMLGRRKPWERSIPARPPRRPWPRIGVRAASRTSSSRGDPRDQEWLHHDDGGPLRRGRGDDRHAGRAAVRAALPPVLGDARSALRREVHAVDAGHA